MPFIDLRTPFPSEAYCWRKTAKLWTACKWKSTSYTGNQRKVLQNLLTWWCSKYCYSYNQ